MTAGWSVHADEQTLDPATLRCAFAAYPSGVTVVAGKVDEAPVGLAASSFTSVSLEPALASVCIARSSATWPVLRQAPRLGVSVLAAGHGAVARALAAKDGDRFARVKWHATRDGAVLLEGSALWLTCAIQDELPAGDHQIILLRIQALDLFPTVSPLIFHGRTFRELDA